MEIRTRNMGSIKSGLIASTMTVLLAGCLGGSNTPSAPAASTLGGVAAVGFPITSGNVNVNCANGAPLSATTHATNGSWQVTLSGQTLPCGVRVSGGSINGAPNTTPYHSIATAPGTVNITPLTDLMVANLVGADPATWFAGLTPAQLAAITQANVNTALANLRTALAAGIAPLNTTNPVTATFTPVPGNPVDDMLAALQAALINSGVTYAALLNNATMPAINPAGGFVNALGTAYSNTQSGGAGGGGAGGISCNTANYQPGAVRVPTANELTTFARNYNGDLGTIDPNTFAFTKTGAATATFGASGTLSYNNQPQTVSSICMDLAVPMLYVEFGVADHIDLFSNGTFAGMVGGNVIQQPAAGGGGGGGALVWTPHTVNSMPFADILWDGAKFVAVTNGPGGAGVVGTSTDGVTWAIPAMFNGSSIAKMGNTYIVAGVAAGTGSDIRTSTGGIAWTNNNNVTGIHTIAASNTTFVGLSGGMDVGAGQPLVISTTTDGITWTARHTVPAVATETITATKPVWNGSTFAVMVNVRNTATNPFTNNNFVLTSPDGVTWTSSVVGAVGRLIWNGTQFALVSTANTQFSTDGVNWNPASASNLPAVSFVGWTGTKYVAFAWSGGVAPNVTVWESTDALSWTSQTMPLAQPITAGVGNGNLYIAVGNNVTITAP